MAAQIFINLPVKNLNNSIEFYTKLGYTFNQQFTSENATCMIISETIYAMLLVESYFKTFTDKQIIDAHKSCEALFALSAENKDKVNELVEKAISSGGIEPRPAIDHGFMYSRSYNDLDGHTWEVFWMDPNHVQG